ncbi:hypothetical protein ACIPY6_43200 [Streptomyces sp. NPDC090054]|uniref:hypothetical protein n=1 Tax=Streptomyces sp. NPDC090054 TaxID=3365933 RepID=UPI0038280DE6
MTDTNETLDHAVTALATGSHQTQNQSVRALVSIALNEPTHRQQALTALENFTTSHPGARSEAVVTARTALCGFDPQRAANALRILEGSTAAFLTTSVAAGSILGDDGTTRTVITLAVCLVLLTAATALRQLWQPYLGAWVLLPRATRWSRGLLVVFLTICLTSGIRAVPDSLGGVLLCAAGAGCAAWLLWSRKPQTVQRRHPGTGQ